MEIRILRMVLFGLVIDCRSLQFQAILKSLANALRDLIIAVGVGVESDGLQGFDINLAVFHLVGLDGGLQHFSDDAKASVVALVFNKLALQGDYVRVYLSAVADNLITAEQLLDAFVRSANSRQKPVVSWMEKWQAIISIIQANKIELKGFETDLPLLTEAARNNQAVHHSRRYNDAYHPHYRIVERSIFEIELKPSLK